MIDLDPEELAGVDKLALSNTVTLSALVTLLVRKGVIDDQELVREIRALRAKLEGQKS